MPPKGVCSCLIVSPTNVESWLEEWGQNISSRASMKIINLVKETRNSGLFAMLPQGAS